MRLTKIIIAFGFIALLGCPESTEDPPAPTPSEDTPDSVTGDVVNVDVADVPEGGDTATDASDVIEAPAPTCEAYCKAVQAACGNNGPTAQYQSVEGCIAYCKDIGKFDAGDAADTSGNTIGCRAYHAGVAATDAASAITHCAHAGPTGANVCGTWCDNYCSLALDVCTGDAKLFPDTDSCTAACAGYAADGTIGESSGNSVQCRIYHLGVAGTNPPDSATQHCPHAGADGGNTCVDNPTVPTCEAYCDAVTAACTGSNLQYADNAACLAYCKTAAQLPAGTAADTDGNTIGCRLYHAGVASKSEAAAESHCSHAGPSGGDTCGTWCDNYCYLALLNCTGDNELYPDGASCDAFCAEGFAINGDPGATSGDTVQCRIYHLGVAGSDGATSAATHCPHGGMDGGGVCAAEVPAPTCQAYCTAVTAACTDANAQYAGGMTECLSYCASWAHLPAGTAADTSGNTIGCRTYHATVAATDAASAATHCPHAGASGGNVCGSWCENYCHLAGTNCTGDNALFGDDELCAAGCGGFSTAGEPGATAGDSVQCRIYHLGVAGTDGATSAATHCPHGAVDGGGVCVEVVPDPTCVAYCASVTAACTGANAQYQSEAECVSYCQDWAKLPIGAAADTAGNTVGCRAYHASVAAGSEEAAATHCVHAGPSGGDVCGTWCDNLCWLESANCLDGASIFTDEAACQTACGALPVTGTPGATAGNSVQCRIYHLGVAGTDGATSAATHCPHGASDGGGVCVDEVATPTCVDYCAKIAASCTGANAQYVDEAACLAYCGTGAALPLGALADTAGNTVGCRLYHAGVAGGSAEAAATHCAHAGPSGGDVCGTWCENYCHLSAQSCTGDNALYADDQSCDAACSNLSADGAPGATAGDSIQCRIYHLGVAGSNGETSAATHCPHGAVDGGGVCVDAPTGPTCADYCAKVTASCTGDNAQYADEPACLAYCATAGKLPLGELADTAGNTVGCRLYHAGVAGGSAEAAALHCDHAGPSGGDVCGTWCENYCHLSAQNCTEANAIHDDDDGCETACAGLSATGAAGDTDGNSIQCRIYHLGAAGSNGETSAATHCPHGAVDGGGVCVATSPTCADYCAKVTAACTGENAQYPDEAACLAYCATSAQLPIGTLADTDGNTVGCRLYHAGVASSSPENAKTHCGHTGPSGGDVCGSWCDNYCHLALTNCDGLFTNAGECGTECLLLKSDGGAGATDGDSVQCRIYHLGVAGTDGETSATLHCPHGDADGGGVCVAAPDADDCETAKAVGALPFTASGDTTNNTNAVQHATDDCEGSDLSTGGGKDQVWTFVASTTGLYSVQVDATFDADVYAVTDCGDVGGTCLGGSDGIGSGKEGLDLVLQSGETVYVVVDSLDASEFGTYSISFALAGAACDLPLTVGALPFLGSGDTGGSGGSASFGAGECAGVSGAGGEATEEQRWAFTPQATGTYDITLVGPEGSTLYVASDCADVAGTCAGAATGESASLTLELDIGTAYTIFVDAAPGEYLLEVAHAVPTCAAYCTAISANCKATNAQYGNFDECMSYCGLAGKLPVGAYGDTAGNTLGCRLYHAKVAHGNPDLHCAHAGPTGGNLCGTWCENYCSLTQQNCTAGAALYASDAECATACAAFSVAGDPGDTAGDTVQCRIYHAGVAGKAGAAALHCPHVAPDGGGVCVVDSGPTGDTCGDSLTIGALPFSTNGDTGGLADDYGYAAGKCPGEASGYGAGGPDQVWTFTAPEAGDYSVTLEAAFDSTLYALTGCDAGACLAADEQEEATERLTLALTSGQKVDLIVDGFGAGESGKYTLSVSRLGDTTLAPFVIDELPFTASGDTADATGSYAFGAGKCTPLGANTGDGSPDEAYAFTASRSGTVEVSLQAPFDSVLYIITDGANPTGTCVGSADLAGSYKTETKLFDVQEGTTYYVIVDGAAGGQQGTYSLSAKWATTCETYCGLVMEACLGELAQYESAAQCLTYCKVNAKLQSGTEFDTDGDTVGCRIYHAGVALTNPYTHCPHAGPSGGGVCGSFCDTYCNLAKANCSGANALYADAASCQTACKDFYPNAPIGATEGDSVQCRIYHLGVAGSLGATSADIHCPHGGPSGGGVCVWPQGDKCNDPFPVGALPFTASESTADAHNDYSGGGAACVPSSNGAGSNDHVYVYTAARNGTIQAKLTPQSFDSVLYVRDGCAGGACVAFADTLGQGNADTLTFDVTAGKTYYLVVDGALDGGSVHGSYTLDVRWATTCATYCGLVTAACAGGNLQYADEAACLAYCKTSGKLATGAETDTDGDTIGCRIYHAGVALSNPGLHCDHAGPTGGNVCGTWCQAYCNLAKKNCQDANSLYANDAECATACAALDANGEPGATDGDSLQCRIYHLGVAGSNGATSAATHCPHGGASGAGVCVDAAPTCDEYCTKVTQSCTGPNAQYTDKAACMTYCATSGKLPAGTAADTEGNTIGCRLYHAGVAATTPAVHCPHAGPTGGNVCGSWCDNYCDLAAANCTGGAAIFQNATECQAECADYSADGALTATDGDSVQCRIYHLGVAGGSGATSAATHCPHATPSGGGVCVKAAPTCAEYCAKVMQTCTAANAQYPDEATCLGYCQTGGKLDAGAYSDTAGDTIGCRLYHAGAAASNAAVHCPHAGASGGNTCGTWCEVYCNLESKNCKDGNSQYADKGACAAACAAFPATAPVTATSGDSVQCRIYHAGAAAANASLHCPHSGSSGGGVCVDAPPTCDEYCTKVTANCTANNSQYADKAACMAHCGTNAKIPAGTKADTAGNTIGCRLYHAGAAATGPAVHCSHAGPNGGGVCGSLCDAYCQQASANCATLYADSAACMTACGAFNAGGTQGDTAGDTVQCRLYHVGVAGSNGATSANLHCPHAGVDGGGVCVNAAGKGDACADPFDVGQPPQTFNGNTSTAQDDYDLATAACGLGANTGKGAKDQVYKVVTPPFSATLSLTLKATFDSALYVITTCANEASTCQKGVDLPGVNQTETITLTTAPSTTYFIVVDGKSTGSGAYSLEVSSLPACEEYCAKVSQSCSGQSAQYTDMNACIAYCKDQAKFPVGTTADTSGNTLGCRLYHAGAAATNAALHCPHAGPLGGGVCGTACDSYCDMASKNCTGVNALYADNAACMTACAAFPATGKAGDTSGDTVQCRIYHLSVASSNASLHCPHAAVDGGNTCVDQGPPAGKDLSGYKLLQSASTQTYTIPANTMVPEGGYLVVGRKASKAEFEAYWGVTLGINVVYLNSGGSAVPQMNGDETFTLQDSSSAVKDGPTIAMTPGDVSKGFKRNKPLGAANLAGSWTAYDPATKANATPGSGQSAGAQAGIYISEFSNPTGTGNFNYEFVEIFIDPGGATPPAAPTYDAVIKPIYANYCGGCHSGGSAGACPGSGCWATHYVDLLKPPSNGGACSGTTTKGACTLKRIQNGSMPASGGCQGTKPSCPTSEEQSKIQAWLDAGMPEK